VTLYHRRRAVGKSVYLDGAYSSEEQPSAKVGSSDSRESELVLYSNIGDTFRVLGPFFRPFLAFISGRTGKKNGSIAGNPKIDT